jgi:hypothetical protein
MAEATRLELLSLHGGEPDGPVPEEHSKEKFHEFPILGTLDLTSVPERERVVREVSQSIRRSPLRMVACFFPRHGIRAELRNDEKLELLICFECSTVYRYHRGTALRLNIDEKPESLLNSLLKNAGIKQVVSARGPGG